MKKKKILCVCVWVGEKSTKAIFHQHLQKTESSKYGKVLPLCPHVYMSNQNAVK